ncbi:hypothetical protein [Flaviaesturariibacter terrae]
MENIINRLNEVDIIVANNDFSRNEFIADVLNSTSERIYLFRLVERNFSKNWFLYLLKLGAFNFKTIPKAVEKNNDGKIEHWFLGWDASILIKTACEFSIKNEDDELINSIIFLINNYIEYVAERKTDVSRNYRPDWFFCDYIFLLPLNKIEPKHLSFIEEHGIKGNFSSVAHDLLTSFFERVIREQHKALLFWILDVVFSVKRNTDESGNLNSHIQPFSLKEFVDVSPQKIYVVLGDEILSWLVEIVKQYTNKNPFQFSKFNIVSIGEDPQNWSSEGVNHLIVKFLRNTITLPAVHLKSSEQFVSENLAIDVPVLRRISYYAIDNNYQELCNLFWKESNPLLDFESKLEVFKLLKAHCKSFTMNEVQVVLNWIDALTFKSDEISDPDQLDRYTAIKKIEWLASLTNVNPEFREKIELKRQELLEVAKYESSHPGYDTWSETRFGGDYGSQRIISLDFKEAISIVADKERWHGYDEWGMQEDLRSLIKERTQEAIDQISCLLSLDYNLLYYAFDAFRDKVQSEKSLPWNNVLDFLVDLLDDQGLWESDSSSKNSVSGLLGMIAWFINEGVKDRDSPLVINGNAEKSIDILQLIERRYDKPFVYLNGNRDKQFDIINSTRGHIYEALISVSIALAKNDPSVERWNKKVRDIFTNRINDETYLDELYWSIGFYLPQISYLDWEWVVTNKAAIFIQNEKIDDFAFKGYLLYSNRLYTNLFELLEEYYVRALNSYSTDDVYSSRIIEHVVIAKSINNPIGEKLLKSIFDQKEVLLFKKLVEVIDRRTAFLAQEELVVIWEGILSKLRSDGSVEAKNVAYATSEFLENVTEINEKVIDLFSNAISQREDAQRIYQLIGYAARFIYDSPVLGGRLLLTLVKSIKGDFSIGMENLLTATEVLFERDEIDIADKICIHLVEQGNYRAKDLYNKFH